MDEPISSLSPLIHIGAAKAASTWMQTRIFRNASLGFTELASRADQKQLLVNPSDANFDAAATARFLTPLSEQALANGMYPVVSVERLSGTSRLGDKNAFGFADRLRAVFPESKILYIVREQNSMWRAQYLQYIRRGGHRSVQWFLDQTSQDDEGSAYFHWDRFKYDDLVQYYQTLFGPERILVLPFEMLASSPQRFLVQLMTFCGLPAESALERLDMSAQRESASALSYALTRKLNLLFARPMSLRARRAKLRSARRRIDQLIPDKWENRFQNHLDRVIAERIGNYYAGSNSVLQTQISMDLSPYAYTLNR